MTVHFYADAAVVSIDQIEATVREQLRITLFGQTDALRTAVCYLPPTLATSDWVEGCRRAGVHAGTARNRLSEVRRQGTWQ
jgi:hypothetical protein